jgi:hypothetical protein
MVNPFDLRAAILAKHAQHVVLIHFPIALFISGFFRFAGNKGHRHRLSTPKLKREVKNGREKTRSD